MTTQTLAAGIPIIDIDSHFTEPPDLWTSRAPARFRDRVLHVRDLPGGGQGWFFGDQMVASPGNNVVRPDGSKARGTLTIDRFDGMTPGGTDPAARLRDMDRLGIWGQLIYPNVIGFGAQALLKVTEDRELLNFHVRAYNDAIADLQARGQGRLYPQAALPFWDPDESLRELTRCRERLGLTGFVMTDQPQHFGLPALSTPYWEPLWKTCEDLNLPVNFHIGSGALDVHAAGYWDREADLMESVVYISTSLFIHNFRDIVNLILTGVCERHPRLNFVSVESGAGWIPFVLKSLEWTFDEMLTAQQRRKYSLRPIEYFKRQIYASYWFEDSVADFIETFGTGNLMFETDYPHPQSLYPGVQEKAAQTLGRFDAAGQRAVLCGNAARVYGIQAPASWIPPAAA
ncbi:MAG: amidohydrolase family protein [Gammaproteobacteria bacterium]